MIRGLRLSDIPRQFLPGRLERKDLVCTHVALHAPRARPSYRDLARWAVPASRDHRAVAVLQNGRLEALVMLRARSAPSAWEIAHAFASARGYLELDELIAAGTRTAAAMGAERLFLRSPSDGPACGPAERAGFRRAFSEELFAGLLALTAGAGRGLRPLLPSDLHGVFRLHSAALPTSARSAVGMTLEQWTASREPTAGRAEEFVWETEHGLIAWLRLDRWGSSVTIEAVLHPGHDARAAELIDGAAQLAGADARARWVVPSYEPTLARTLSRRGWRSDGTYEVFVRPVAERVRASAMAPAQA